MQPAPSAMMGHSGGMSMVRAAGGGGVGVGGGGGGGGGGMLTGGGTMGMGQMGGYNGPVMQPHQPQPQPQQNVYSDMSSGVQSVVSMPNPSYFPASSSSVGGARQGQGQGQAAVAASSSYDPGVQVGILMCVHCCVQCE